MPLFNFLVHDWLVITYSNQSISYNVFLDVNLIQLPFCHDFFFESFYHEFMIDMTRLGLNLFTISMEMIKIILKIMLYISPKKKKKDIKVQLRILNP